MSPTLLGRLNTSCSCRWSFSFVSALNRAYQDDTADCKASISLRKQPRQIYLRKQAALETIISDDSLTRHSSSSRIRRRRATYPTLDQGIHSTIQLCRKRKRLSIICSMTINDSTAQFMKFLSSSRGFTMIQFQSLKRRKKGDKERSYERLPLTIYPSPVQDLIMAERLQIVSRWTRCEDCIR